MRVRVRSPLLWTSLVHVGVAACFFCSHLFLGQTVVREDIGALHYPHRVAWARALHDGQLPLWNPYLFCGAPFAADPHTATWYPPNLLFLLFSSTTALSATLIFHALATGLFTQLLAQRVLGLSPFAGLLAGLAFTYCGAAESEMVFQMFYVAIPWFVFALLCFGEGLRSGRALPGAGVGLGLALQLVAGGAQLAYYTLVVLALWAVLALLGWAPPTCRRTPLRRVLTTGGLAALFMAGLGACQVAPTLELTTLSARPLKPSVDYATFNSVSPGRLFGEAIFPTLRRSLEAAQGMDYGFTLTHSYVPLVTLALALLAAVHFRAQPRVRLWCLLGVVGLLLSLGKYLPGYGLLCQWVPGFGSFRMPQRWLLLYALSASLLSGIGADLLLATEERLPRRAAWTALGLLSAVFMAGGLARHVLAVQTLGTGLPFGMNEGRQLLVLVLCAGMVLYFLLRPPLALFSPEAAKALVVVLCVADLWFVVANMERSQTVPASVVTQTPANVALLQAAGPWHRIAVINSAIALHQWQAPGAASLTEQEWLNYAASAKLAALIANVGELHGLQMVGGAWGGPLPLRRHPQVLYEPGATLEARRRWLNWLGVDYFVGPYPLTAEAAEPVLNDFPTLYRNTQALPRAFFAQQAQSVPWGAEVEAMVARTVDFAPDRVSLVEGLSSDFPDVSVPGEAQVEPLTYEMNTVHLRAHTAQARVLNLADNWYPGWQAFLDGKRCRLYRSNYVMRAVVVPAGSHEVTMVFLPNSVRVGLFVSLLALLCAAAVGAASLVNWRFSRRSELVEALG